MRNRECGSKYLATLNLMGDTTMGVNGPNNIADNAPNAEFDELDSEYEEESFAEDDDDAG